METATGLPLDRINVVSSSAKDHLSCSDVVLSERHVKEYSIKPLSIYLLMHFVWLCCYWFIPISCESNVDSISNWS